jgi:cell division protein FtsW (lipid II flippase)
MVQKRKKLRSSRIRRHNNDESSRTTARGGDSNNNKWKEQIVWNIIYFCSSLVMIIVPKYDLIGKIVVLGIFLLRILVFHLILVKMEEIILNRPHKVSFEVVRDKCSN